jgi:suppressor of fused protein SUFU
MSFPMILERVRSHYRSHWGQPSRAAEFTFGQETYEVYKWDAATHPEEVNVYATNGASSYAPASEKHRFEIFMGLVPAADDAAVTLAMAASYPSRQEAELGDGHTITFEEPVWPGTTMRSLLLTMPLELIIPDLTLEARAHVVFLQAIPLFESELALKKRDGAESLLARWRAARVRFWDPGRAALA